VPGQLLNALDEKQIEVGRRSRSGGGIEPETAAATRAQRQTLGERITSYGVVKAEASLGSTSWLNKRS
jgi:hypothetical protein